jgi:hypothetical protein
MASWQDVVAVAERLPDVRLGQAHEGSPAFYVGRHPFARLRWDDEQDEREILQTWSGDLNTEAALARRRDVFPVVSTFTFRVSTWAYLDRLDATEAAELVLESYLIRGPVGRRGMDVAPYLPEH